MDKNCRFLYASSMKTSYEVAQVIDHTLLKTSATDEQIALICKEAAEHQFKAVCIPPTYLKLANKMKSDETNLCTVIGFPLGYQLSKTKILECEHVLALEACEVDMVININQLKNQRHDELLYEISEIAKRCHDKNAILKVIIETSELSLDEKKVICEICVNAKADFVKTSTGFSSSGADLEDIKLMRSWLPSEMKIKASGGIRTLDQAIAFMDAGADRLGMSAGVSVMKELGLITS